MTAPDPYAGKIPVTVVTGFLGSGKTTLINRLLARAELANTAVIVNEYGEQGIDHELIRFSSEKVLLLENGCVCCALRGDLQQTLRDLFLARRGGEIGDFERVLLETTGLADPAPVLQTLLTDTMLLAHYRLNGVVAVCDAHHALGQLGTHPEAVKQAALADRIVISKPDLVKPEMLAEVRRELAALAPSAQLAIVEHGAVEPGFVIDIGIADARTDANHLERWLGRTSHELEHHGHDHAIQTFTLRFERPFSARAFEQAIEVLTALRGTDLLRVKGLVNVEGEAGPLVVQGVQHLFHPPVALDAWPGADRSSRLVFITRGITRETVAALFAAVASIAT